MTSTDSATTPDTPPSNRFAVAEIVRILSGGWTPEGVGDRAGLYAEAGPKMVTDGYLVDPNDPNIAYSLTGTGRELLDEARAACGTEIHGVNHRPRIDSFTAPNGVTHNLENCVGCPPCPVVGGHLSPYPCAVVTAYWPDLPITYGEQPLDHTLTWLIDTIYCGWDDLPTYLLDRTVREVGKEKAFAAWDQAEARFNNNREIVTLRGALIGALAEAEEAIDRAEAARNMLAGDRVYDVDHAESYKSDTVERLLRETNDRIIACAALVNEIHS